VLSLIIKTRNYYYYYYYY